MRAKLWWVVCLCAVGMGVYGVYKPLPEGISVRSESRTIAPADVSVLFDTTYTDSQGVRQGKQEIFDEILRLVEGAEHFIVLDMFFYSDFLGTATTSSRTLARELTDAVVRKKESTPSVTIQVITDPLNTFYGGHESVYFKTLRRAGISVTETDLTALRDSNPLYSGWWRLFLRFVPDFNIAFLPHPFDSRGPRVPVGAYLDSLNFKANHRKVMVADTVRADGSRGMATLVTSFNPHDGSSMHSNTALRIDTHVWRDVLKSEEAVLRFSDAQVNVPQLEIVDSSDDVGYGVSLITEGAIHTEILDTLARAGEGDTLLLTMFYLSDRDIVHALKDADTNGATIRIILDPNKDAFGREKNGIPNRMVAHELMTHTKGNTTIRWCATSGEQCHSKWLLFLENEEATFIHGSANFTRRNLHNINLETDVVVRGTPDMPLFRTLTGHFDMLWSNDGGVHTADYATYEDRSFFKMVWYRLGEWSGMSHY